MTPAAAATWRWLAQRVSAAVLAKQAAGAAPCDAKSGSKALAQNVITQKLNQKRGH